jgi:hypothetical protein
MKRIIAINTTIVVLLALACLIYPPIRTLLDLLDPALQAPGIPQSAWRLYQNLTPRYAAWAQRRVAQGAAENLSINNISGTEWPLFGSVFYLWGIENLQTAWEAGDRSADAEPRIFARDGIIAASELVVDPRHSAWVQKHWGADYLHREDVFYRMLVIAALTSREKLLHDGAHTKLLRDQVESFAKELDASATGLLDDYPGECYPGDVMAAIASIRRADAVLGTDHSAFADRALRAFTGTRATRLQLPPYMADAGTGRPTTSARGCANSYVCLTSPDVWPSQAQRWYAIYDKFFWQERGMIVGYREFANNGPKIDWTMDVDAGPVIAGFGVSASAFGVGAARKNGRFDRAYPLAAEMLLMKWELPNGVLALPRVLSNLSDAPMLGEAAILWQLTIQPEKGFPVKSGGAAPASVYIVIAGTLIFGTFLILETIYRFKIIPRKTVLEVRAPKFQCCAWAVLLLGGLAALWLGFWAAGLALLLLALILPIKKKMRADGSPTPAKPAAGTE